jgi:nucleoside-diphosphate-sugar epimerase
MRICITGGAGFLGSHLAERLVAVGHHVLVLDDLSTGQMANLAGLVGHPRFAYRVGSVINRPLVAEVVDLADVTVHLAAGVGVRLIVERSVHTIETNVHGTEVVLSCAAKKGKHVILASTSEVYGKGTRVPFMEEDDLTLGGTQHSRWAYACSKALDEWLALAYARERGVPVTICRFFNTAGPRQSGRYGMVLPTFAAQAVRGEPITVFGAGEQTRCFAHVADVVECIRRLMASPAAIGQVFNIGTAREVTINGLAEMVRDVAKSNSVIVHIPYDEAYAAGFEDMQRRVPDCSKLSRTIGFEPTTPLEAIIADVVADQRARLEREAEVTE